MRITLHRGRTMFNQSPDFTCYSYAVGGENELKSEKDITRWVRIEKVNQKSKKDIISGYAVRRREVNKIQEGILLSGYTLSRDSIIEYKTDLAKISKDETIRSFGLKSNLFSFREKCESIKESARK